MALCVLLAAIALTCQYSTVIGQQPGLTNPRPGGGFRGPNGQPALRGPNTRPAIVGPDLRNGGNGSPPGAGPNQQPCSSAGRAAVTQCFVSNGGFQMQYVIGLLSNGTQGQVPINAEQMLGALCQAQGNIIGCIFNSVNGFRNSAQCPTAAEFTRLEQEAVTLITGIQRTCGNGAVQPAGTCLKDLNSNLRQCYTKVGLNPELFTPSGDPLKMAGSVIGENKETAAKFCRVKQELFDCMKEQLDACPGSVEVMSLGGYDHESLQKGIDVLCRDVDVYVDGLRCFQRPTPEVQECVTSMVDQVTRLTSQQVRNQISRTQFYNRFCQVRIQQMECDYRAWKNHCEPATVGLKNEFECNLLPTRCKHDSSLQSSLQRTCAIQRYERHLRSSATSHATTSGLIMTILTFSLILFL